MKRTTFVLAVLGVLALFAWPAQAEDVSLVSPRRLSVAAQAGVDWLRATNTFDGVQTKPAVKLVPSYNLFGKPGKSTGSVALNFPAKLTLNADHRFEMGAYISIVVWSGKDLP